MSDSACPLFSPNTLSDDRTSSVASGAASVRDLQPPTLAASLPSASKSATVAPKAMQKPPTCPSKRMPPSPTAVSAPAPAQVRMSDPAIEAVHAAKLAEAKVAAACERQAATDARAALAAAEQKMATAQIAKSVVRAEIVKELEDEVS